MSIQAISPVFSVGRNDDHFCTTAQGRRNLEQLGARIAGSEALVGLYVTESAEPGYVADPATRGRVVALVRMLPMPQTSTVADYPSECMEYRNGKIQDRWPFGWPSEIVFFSPQGGPVLRDAVAFALHTYDFAGFAGQFLQGPINIRTMPALRDQLMIQVRHELARNPTAQLRPF